MTLIETPLGIAKELSEIRSQSERGIELLAEAEKKRVRLELEAERKEALVFIEAGGTVADRTAIAKLESIALREDAELAKVEVNRIKTKLKHLSEALMATQSAGKMIELQYRIDSL